MRSDPNMLMRWHSIVKEHERTGLSWKSWVYEMGLYNCSEVQTAIYWRWGWILGGSLYDMKVDSQIVRGFDIEMNE